MNTQSTPPNKPNYDNWDLYNLLSNTLQFYHSRWVDNYRIFLSFNSFLLPATTAILGYALKENLPPLRYLMTLFCIVGILASSFGYRLLKRIHLDTALRFHQLIRVEDSLEGMPLKPFTEGKEFFFGKNKFEYEIVADASSRKLLRSKGTRAIDAYRYISISIIICYIIIGIFGIWPLISSLTCRST